MRAFRSTRRPDSRGHTRSGNRFTKKLILPVFTAVLAVVGLFGAAMSAAVPTAHLTSPMAIVLPMRVVGVDPVVAAQYQQQAAAPSGVQLVAFAGSVVPTDVRTGNCGSSYLFLDPLPRGLKVRTGFSLNEPAVSFSWTVDVFGPSGFRETWGGELPGMTTWDGVRNRGNLSPGEYRGLVTAPSQAVLSDGRVCQSLGPADTKPVF